MRTHLSLGLAAVMLIASSLMAGHVSAQTSGAQVDTTIPNKTTTRDGRYSDREEGWFWYKDPPPEAKKPPPPKPKPVTGSPEKPKVLSAEWLRDNMDKYRYIAIDNPTRENMEMYLLLQKLMLDKSEKFAIAHRRYASLNPGIDETVQNPVGGTARRSMDVAQEKAMNEVLAKLGKHVGVWYFFRSDCQYCHQANPAVEQLAKLSNISVVPISLDHKASIDGMLQNWRPDGGQGEMLGVTGTPTMFLVNPDTKKIVSLAVGVRTLPDLQRRILEVGSQEQWITRKDYELAMRGLERRFLTEHINEKELEDDPQKLLALLRKAASGSVVQEANLDDLKNGPFTPWKASKGTRR